jgi:hypothetical protein
MHKRLRLVLLAGAVAGALAFAGSALATPRLIIAGKTALGSAQVSIQLLEEKTDAAPARIVIYAPAGYTAVTSAAPGTAIGTAHADLQALAINADTIIPAEGQIVAADPAAYTSNACAPGTHTAVWLLNVSVSGQTLSVPVYVDAPPPSTDALAGASPLRLTVCFTSPYVAPPVGAPFGAKVLDAILQLNQGIVTTPSTRGSYAWRGFITPYAVGTATPNLAGTVETRGIVDTPQILSISVKVTNRKKHMVRITGTVKAGDVVIGGANVTLSRGPARNKTKPTTKKKTNANGVVVFNLRFKKKATVWFGLATTVPAYDATSEGCKSPTTPALSCVSATANGFSASTSFVKVVV